MARGGAIQRRCSPATPRPASPSCAWRRLSTPAPYWRPGDGHRRARYGEDLARSSRATRRSADRRNPGEDRGGRVREVPQPSWGSLTRERSTKPRRRSIGGRMRRNLASSARLQSVADGGNPLNGVQLRVWDAEMRDPQPHDRAAHPVPGTVLAANQGGIDVACGRGVLRILRLQLPAEAARGARVHPGTAARRRALRAGMRPRAPVRVLWQPMRWRGFCARA